MGLVAIMGSGETAPPMVRTHREIFEQIGSGPAVLLDTPFGFQENADELVAKTEAYFAQTVGRAITAVRWRDAEAPILERESALATLGQARWAFAGPGSPTYALRHWRGTAVPRALSDVVERGGALVLGSAAAVTVGSHAVPVYEIYKVGEEPAWVEGLDLLAALCGVRAAVIPHFDNAEGGTHDTRYCYLGQRRLHVLESQLPDDVGVLGVDEHTALLLDLEAGVARVRGNAVVTVWRGGPVQQLVADDELSIASLASLLRGEGGGAGTLGRTAADRLQADASRSAVDHRAEVDVPDEHAAACAQSVPPSLSAEVERARNQFDAGIDAGDVDASVAAILAVEEAISAWSSDPLQSDEADRARRELRAMVVRLGDLARVGARDPRDVVGPYVEALIEVRRAARDAGDFTVADDIRQRLATVGVEVRDTPAGAEWHLGGGRSRAR